MDTTLPSLDFSGCRCSALSQAGQLQRTRSLVVRDATNGMVESIGFRQQEK